MLIYTGHIPLSPSMDLTTLYRNRWPKEGIYDTITFSNTVARVHAREGLQRVLQHEIYNTLHNRGDTQACFRSWALHLQLDVTLR